MAIITISGVSRRFGGTTAVDDVTLTIAEGEFFALLGPSGCGKTTLLRMLAGLESPDAGRITIDGADMAGVPPNKRPVNMVFQNYAVFPHMNVADNIGYGLKVAGVGAAERAAKVEAALALVKLDGLGARSPAQLSGGQRQRVALARALILQPRVLLLDEPLSALDARLREIMRGELAELQRRLGITFVIVTHDQDEALAMATRCAVMNAGRLEQVAAPAELYEAPASRFVAGFIGAVNILEGRVIEAAAGHALLGINGLAAPVRLVGEPGLTQGSAAAVALRPEKISISPGHGDVPPADNHARGEVSQILYLGSESLYEVDLGNGMRLKVLRSNRSAREPGDFGIGSAVSLSWQASAPVVLPA
jgi:spermidine/putrescine transport system ATP-binding protein